MENQKTKIISIASIIALALTLVSATFAYFMAQTGEGKSTDIKINASTVDTLTFEAGAAISLNLNQENFASGKGNQSDTTFAKAMLTANNKTNTATEHYYMYLDISENTFTYTQDENTPEILLTIKDANGNAITSITGLTHKTVTDGKGASISGFDITTKKEAITLFNNREITANPTKTEQWNITVTFVNYNANQTGNAGKSFNAKLMIRQESQSNQTLLADYVISQYTGTQGENSLYYHNSSLTNGAGDNSYRYAGASESVNNFVCFGSTTNPCPTDNLYRIIGVFEDKVKLIKYDYATSALLGTNGDYYGTSTPSTSYYKGSLTSIDQYYWNNATKKNTWSESNLNKINLNKNFINNIGSTWANKIATTTWKVGGNTSNNIAKSIPSVAYQNEIVAPVENITYDAKIGLMYVSDYGFAASPSAWTTTLYNYDGNDAKGTSIKTINWMYMGYYDWMISRYSDRSSSAFFVYGDGYVSSRIVSNSYGVRPSFNLLSSITYVSGSGSAVDPILIN